MYYYAWIDSTSFICYEVIESETPITDDPYSIQIASFDRSYINRKKYIDGVWLDASPIEAQVMQAEVIGIGEEWLDNKIYAMADAIENHTHSEYSPLSHSHTNYSITTHTHTADAIGAIAAGDIAAVSEVETYLGI